MWPGVPLCSSRRSAPRPVARSGLRLICLLSVARSQRALPSRRRRRNSARHSHARGHRPLRLSRCPSARRTTRHSCRPVSAQESRQTDEARPPRAQARRGGAIAARGARGCFKDGARSRCEKKGSQGGGLGACGAAEGATKGPTSKRTQTLLRRVISQRLGRLGRVLIGTFSFLSSFRPPVIASCPRLKPWNMCSPAMSVDEADASPDGSQRAWSGASRAKGAHTVHDGGVASRDALRVRTRHCICWCPPSACQALVTPTACSLAARRWPLGTPGLVGPAYTRRHELMFGASREKQAPEMSDSVLQKYESISRLLVSRRLYYAYSGGRGALSLRRT